MNNDKHELEFEETELAADHTPHSVLPDNKKSGDSTDTATYCRGMSCRKKIILAAIATLALLAIILVCARWCWKCGCGDKK
jgi:hypothetical protein